MIGNAYCGRSFEVIKGEKTLIWVKAFNDKRVGDWQYDACQLIALSDSGAIFEKVDYVYQKLESGLKSTYG